MNNKVTMYINFDLRNRKLQTYSSRYGFKKFDYPLDCIKFLENNPLGIDYIRFDFGGYYRPFEEYCKHSDIDYDRRFEINPQSDYDFQEICKALDRLEDVFN